eukprot:11914269-Ditylum_brightwellii.AAC.1
MHMGNDGSYIDSKTEAVYFPTPGITLLPSDKLQFAVDSGYITYMSEFEYLGSYVTHNLNDTFDIKNCVVQATKALNSLMPHVFCNKSLTKHVKTYCLWLFPVRF